MRKYLPITLTNIFILTSLFSLTGCFESSSSDSGSQTPAVATPSIPCDTPPYMTLDTGPDRTCAAVIPAGNCNDGVDNDGDGLTDWQEDLGCSGPTDDEAVDCRDNEDGWTTYGPHSTDTDIIYVSSNLGDDAFSGFLPTPDGFGDGPKKSIAAAMPLIRDGFADWVLFRRGDTWTDEIISHDLDAVSGISPEYPIVIASYGPSTIRPKFNYSGITSWLSVGTGDASNISILGLELNEYKMDPNDVNFNPASKVGAIGWLGSGGNFLFEDCKINYAQVNLMTLRSPTGYFEVRRNILTNSYSIQSHAQSMFTDISNPLLIEGNIMNHGGWNDDFRLGLTAPQTTLATWQAINDGAFDIELEGAPFQISGADFTGSADLDAVAQVLEDAINAEIAQPGAVTVSFTQGNAIILSSLVYLSDANYSISAYTGAGGTDISGVGFLNASVSGVPNSTIFNRNMYLSHGLSNTALIGNIDANGASGGTQLRMGGLIDNNLFLQNPISIVVGSSQNDPQDVCATIKNNVILESRNIDTQLQGTGIDIISNEAANGYGPSYINNVEVYNNIIAHGTSVAQFNIKGIIVGGDGPHINLDIHHNIIYNWTNPVWADPNDHRAYGFIIGDLNPSTTNSFFRNNIIQQPISGYVGNSVIDPMLILSGNTYFSAEDEPPASGSIGWFSTGASVDFDEWFAVTFDTSTIPAVPTAHVFTDPNRTIARYHNEVCGGGASFDEFMTEALKQSRLTWDNRYTADAVNTWIRDGFDLTYE